MDRDTCVCLLACGQAALVEGWEAGATVIAVSFPFDHRSNGGDPSQTTVCNGKGSSARAQYGGIVVAKGAIEICRPRESQ